MRGTELRQHFDINAAARCINGIDRQEAQLARIEGKEPIAATFALPDEDRRPLSVPYDSKAAFRILPRRAIDL